MCWRAMQPTPLPPLASGRVGARLRTDLLCRGAAEGRAACACLAWPGRCAAGGRGACGGCGLLPGGAVLMGREASRCREQCRQQGGVVRAGAQVAACLLFSPLTPCKATLLTCLAEGACHVCPQEAIRLQPGNIDAHTGLGVSLRELVRWVGPEASSSPPSPQAKRGCAAVVASCLLCTYIGRCLPCSRLPEAQAQGWLLMPWFRHLSLSIRAGAPRPRPSSVLWSASGLNAPWRWATWRVCCTIRWVHHVCILQALTQG